MAKFLSFEVVGNAAAVENGEYIVNQEAVILVKQTAVQTVQVFLTNTAAAQDKLDITLSTSTSSQVNPVFTSNKAALAFNYALTANPGGVKAKVFLPVDDNGDQVYVSDVAFS